MARYDVKYACGHVEEAEIFGSRKDVEWKMSKMAKGTCEACKKAAFDKKCSDASDAAKKAGLPALTGSEKQVAWAEAIRADAMKSFEAEANEMLASKDQMEGAVYLDKIDSLIDEIRAYMKSITSAKTWIENREQVNFIPGAGKLAWLMFRMAKKNGEKLSDIIR